MSEDTKKPNRGSKTHIKTTKAGGEIQIGVCKHCGVHFKDKRKRICNECKENIVEENKEAILYTIIDEHVGTLEVKRTAKSPWWEDKSRVEKLIQAFKWSATNDEARLNAGITKGQYDYFIEIHPEFSDIKKACKSLPDLNARKTIAEKIPSDVSVAQWWATRRMSREFGDKIKVEDTRPPRDLSAESKKRLKDFQDQDTNG